MDRFRTPKLFITVSLLVGVCQCWSVSVDRSVNAVRGSCVVVPCSTVAYSKVAWYKYVSRGYPTVYSNDRSVILSEFRGRTSVPGSQSRGDCSLKIDNVQDSDSKVRLYVWVWDKEGYNQGFYDDHQIIKMNVLNPTSPQISVGTSDQVEGKPFTATCKFLHSCRSSSPQIHWHGASPISNTRTNPKESAGLWETEETATFKLTQNTRLSCSSSLSGTPFSSTSIPINVLYAPRNVRIDYTRSSTVAEGNTISLQCTSNSNPAVTAYEWVVTQNTTSTRYRENPLVLQNVRRDTSVSCSVTNSVGTGRSQQLSLSVNYSPTILPGSFCSTKNERLTCECQAEANPKATISWTVDGSSALSPTFNTTTRDNGSLTSSELTGPQGHNVTCTATNNVGKEFTQLLVQFEGTASTLVVAGAAGAAGVCFIIILAVALIMPCKKRRHAEPGGDFTIAQPAKRERKCHVYSVDSDENLYANTELEQCAYKEQVVDSSIYANYDSPC